MTRTEFSVTIENFLHTLDRFKITSSEYGDWNYYETEWLESWWLQNGFEIDGY